ncbi:DUF1648 domain-containing protein [Leifsonia sp. YAF41]|uniref:DUF1648 domain-containing protein n=1 Tax=Leifsonia sp. YAF41 TaxID=3233086 RepID=UPI003F9A8566
MSWFAVILSLVIMAFVAVMMLLMPSITRATLPLGVSIPQQRIGEPVVLDAVKRYRWGVGLAFAVSAVATLLLAGVSVVAAVIVPVLLQLVLSIGAYVVCRRSIQRAKTAEHWYQDVPVRLSGTITGTPMRASTPIGWYIAATLLLAVVAAVGVSLYDSLPTTLTTHWNAAGEADGFAPKSVWSVFGPLLIGLVMIVFLFSIARLTSRIPLRRVADYSAEQQLAMQDLMQQLVGQLTLVLAAIFGAISLQSWFTPRNEAVNLAIAILAPVLIFLLIGVFLVRQRRIVRRVAVTVGTGASAASGVGASASEAAGSTQRADTPDDDRYWKGGMIYLNRNDPALWVPKRFGVGWTVNLGHPGGIAIMTIPVLIVIGVVIVAIGSSPR